MATIVNITNTTAAVLRPKLNTNFDALNTELVAATSAAAAANAAVALRAPIANPAFTGVPTVPTAAPGTNSTQAASTAFVAAAVAAVGGGGTNTQQKFTGDGSTVAFTLTTAPASGIAEVSVNGLVQEVTTDYSISGVTLTFVVAPANLDVIQVFYSSAAGGSGDMVLASVQTVTGAKTFGAAGNVGKLKIAGTTSGVATLDAPAVAGSAVITLPGATSTLATLAGTEALFNKSISGSLNTLTNLPAGSISGVIPIANLATGTPTGSKFIRDDGTLQAIPGGGDALTSNPLSQFAATTSAQLRGVLSDETGTGVAVFNDTPTLIAPALGTPSSGNLSSCTADGTNSVGFRTVPPNSQSAAYTAVLTDSGKSIDHPASDTNARTFTIPANASVAYPVGTCITFTNMTSQVVTIAITSDTMYLAGAGTTGSRSLAQYGIATARKLTSTTWLISGTNLT